LEFSRLRRQPSAGACLDDGAGFVVDGAWNRTADILAETRGGEKAQNLTWVRIK
jgi:hypothetical protein